MVFLPSPVSGDVQSSEKEKIFLDNPLPVYLLMIQNALHQVQKTLSQLQSRVQKTVLENIQHVREEHHAGHQLLEKLRRIAQGHFHQYNRI